MQPIVREVRDDDGMDLVVFYESDGSGAGLVVRYGAGGAELAADFADQAQDWAVEALCAVLKPAVWPECPAHPDAHPLAAGVVSGVAVWSCPKTRRTVAPIGELGS